MNLIARLVSQTLGTGELLTDKIEAEGRLSRYSLWEEKLAYPSHTGLRQLQAGSNKKASPQRKRIKKLWSEADGKGYSLNFGESRSKVMTCE